MALQRWFKLSWYVDVKEFAMDHHLEKSLYVVSYSVYRPFVEFTHLS